MLPAFVAFCLVLTGLLPLGWSSAGNVRAQDGSVPYGDVIVVLTDPRADAARFARDEGVNPRRVYRNVFRGFSANITQRRAERLARHPRVAMITPIEEFQIAEQTLPAGIDRVNADLNPVANINGVDERVDADIAVLDTGIDLDHSDLNVAGGIDCTDIGTFDDNGTGIAVGHGTHVAGIAAAIDNDFGVVGVAPGARLWAIRVLDRSGSGSTDEIICGLDWVVAHADMIDVVNMSLATSGSDTGCWAHALHLAICSTVASGVPVAVAAGNNGGSASNAIPAAYDEVIAVSNFADYDGQPGGLGSSPCNNGLGTDDDELNQTSKDGPAVDIAAPGTCVYSTLHNGGYGYKTGTSMATPHVTGAIALFKSVNPGASPDQVRAWLLSAAEPQDGPNGITGDTDGFPEPVLSVAQEIGEPPLLPPGPPFYEIGGQVVMEAEHAHQFISRDDRGWLFRNVKSAVSMPGYAGDGFVRVEPDNGGNWVNGYATTAPEMQFQVEFATPGIYHLWLRAQADDHGDDSIHAGINGTTPSTADKIKTATVGGGWAWTESTMDGPVATINVPSAGRHTINLWAREDGFRLDRVLLTTNASYVPTGVGPAESPQVAPPLAFQETDGFVEFEAEDYHDKIDRSNHDWRFENDVIAGYSGAGYLRVRPDSGHYWLSGYATTSPEVRYQVQFSTTGTYYVWARMQASDAADDTMHVGLNGVPLLTADKVETDGTGGGFRWSNDTMDRVPATINVTSPGVHTINVWAREDGLRLDQVILTTDSDFSPTAVSDPPVTPVEVEFEAEDFTNTIDRDGHAWSVETNVAGHSGDGFVRVTPDDGTYWLSNYATTAPELQYTVDLPAAGSYRVWLLTQADDGGDNSLHVGIDGTAPESGENITTAVGPNWSWASATVDVPTAGDRTLNLWAREDGLRIDRIILSNDPGFEPAVVSVVQAETPTPSPTIEATATTEPLPPFAEQNGAVVLEAEAFHVETPRGDVRWTAQADVEGFAGAGFMRAEPDSGLVIDTGYAETSPALAYEVEFAGAGPYYVWLRGLATGGDDSLHVGVNGQEVVTARSIDLVEDGAWRWTNAVEGGVATVEIPGPGVHTINVWMADDGLRLDRLILTSDPAFVPDGQGPPASPRTDVASASAANPTATVESSPTTTPDPSPTATPTEEVTPEPTATATEPPPTSTPTPEPTATASPEPTPTEAVTEEAEEEASDGL
ncbi:MAG: S8 family serine peptidase [Thermomicrobiales bacterium]